MNIKVNKNMYLRIFIWICLILWLAGIFFLSSRPTDISLKDSAWFMEKLGITNSLEQGLDKDNQQIMNLQQYIRKKAHVILFAVLSILFFLSLYGYAGKSKKTALISFVFTVLYAVTDEIHQIFSKRGAQLRDVIVDARGAVWGLMIILIIFIIIENTPKLQLKLNKIYNFNLNKE